MDLPELDRGRPMTAEDCVSTVAGSSGGALAWQDLALCAQVDPELFFPENGGSSRPAKQVCARCPVQRQCLEHAVDHRERYGIWGGMVERERRRIPRSGGHAA